MRASVRLLSLVVVAGLVLVGCGSDDEPAAGGPSTSASAADATTTTGAPVDVASLGPEELAAAICATDGEGGEGEAQGQVQNPTLGELSGRVASAKNPGVLWAHNDSGGEPVAYAIGPDGADLGVWDVAGAEAVDWEEMAGWYDAEADEHHLFFADIGDNNQVRDSVTIYGVPEPTVDPAAGVAGGTTDRAEVYELTYADGSHDAEAFFVEPASGDFYVLTKGWGTGISQVFRAADPRPGRAIEMEKVGTVDLKAVGSYATAADADARVIVVRTYDEVVVWPVVGTVAESLAAAPCTGPSADEAQGEAIALAPDGTGYVTISEGQHSFVNWFPFTG
jgi:hypothetical protein